MFQWDGLKSIAKVNPVHFWIIRAAEIDEACAVVHRFTLSSMDMEQRDYDSRTALHVAAAEGTAWCLY
uniref:Uncharacterized protein n=1 Tax=Anguilla anguilla TaxID=7936 RepID=A0A0E9U2D2_ANGAN